MTVRRVLTPFWEAHPFFRILLPWMAGIAVADMGNGFCSIPFIYILSVAIVMGVAMCVSAFRRSWHLRAWYGVCVFSFYFFAGGCVCSLKWRGVVREWSDSPSIYKAQLMEDTGAKARSRLCPIKLMAGWDDRNSCWRPLHGEVLLYLPKDTATASLGVGDVLQFYGQIRQPKNFTEEFDYVRYLYHQGVSGTLYTARWQAVSQLEGFHPLRWRQKLLTYYRSSGLSDEAMAVYPALTLGYKRELGDDVRQLYDVSGASHVLALSGLHIGIFCGVLVGLFSLIFRGRRAAKWCRLLSLPFVWGYVCLVGAPVSAVRAAAMFSCLVVGGCVTLVGFSFNTLCLTAFGMLLYNPFYLFDVGFQLSFMAVASLLLLTPWLQELVSRPKSLLVRYFWGMTVASLAAQIGVAPLIMLYFSRISPYALLVNLWVIPLAFLLVCSAVPFWILALLPWEPLRQVAAGCINVLVRLLNGGLEFFGRLPGADVSGFSFSMGEALSLYVALFFLFFMWMHQCRRGIIGVLAALCFGVFLRLLS